MKPRCEHTSTTGFPFRLVGQVEDQQMILRRGFADLVSALRRELQMVGLVRVSENDAVEAIVVVKLGEDREVQPGSIHRRNGC